LAANSWRVTGLISIAKLMLQANDINGALLLIFITGVLLFLYSIYCGKKLLLEPDKKISIVYSIINYIAQVLQWYFFGYGFTYCSGIDADLGAQKLEFLFNIGFTSNFAMSIHTNDTYFLKINLFALFVVIALFDILDEQKEIRKQNEEIDATSTLPANP